MQERSSFTFDAILDAAEKTILEEGVDVLQMSVLAKRAGVSAGSLYQYFPDKTSVVMALVDRLCMRRLGDLKRVAELAREGSLELFLEHIAAAVTEIAFSDLELKAKLRPALSSSEGSGEPWDITEPCAQFMAQALRSKLDVSEERLRSLGLLLVWTTDGLLEGAYRHGTFAPVELRNAMLDAWRGILARA